MSVVNVSGTNVSQASYKKARSIAESKKEAGGARTTSSVMASIRNMMPGWNIGVIGERFTGSGMRNLEIDYSVLERMAEDPEELVRFKAIILDLEGVVQELEYQVAENPSLNEMILEIVINAEGNIIARGTARTADGVERRRAFDLEGQDLPSWAELISRRLEDIRENRAAEEAGSRSWLG